MGKLATLKTINKEIHRVTKGTVELVKGEGYFYFVYDDGTRYETRSVMTAHLRSQDGAQWIVDAMDFQSDVEERG